MNRSYSLKEVMKSTQLKKGSFVFLGKKVGVVTKCSKIVKTITLLSDRQPVVTERTNFKMATDKEVSDAIKKSIGDPGKPDTSKHIKGLCRIFARLEN